VAASFFFVYDRYLIKIVFTPKAIKAIIGLNFAFLYLQLLVIRSYLIDDRKCMVVPPMAHNKSHNQQAQ
jgi:hypothetical protein